MMTTETAPRIYVACLASYNAGRLHGAWIDADQDADEIADGVQRMLAASPSPGAEEWAIHDYEGFGSYSLSEYESFETVATLARAMAESHAPAEVFAAWLANDPSRLDGADADELSEQFAEAYRGEWGSEREFAEDYAEQVFEIPDRLASYIDYDAVWNDLDCSGYWTVTDASYRVHVFEPV